MDATRALKAPHIILTVIEKEHTEILGKDPRDIVREKLGILHKESQSLFCMPQRQVRKEEIERIAREFSPHLKIFFYEEKEAKSNFFNTKEKSYLEKNRDFASFVLENLQLTYQKKVEIQIPGRLEKHSFPFPGKRSKELIFDVAHNPPGIVKTLENLSCQEGAEYPKRSLVLLAVLKHRSFQDCLSAVREAGFFQVKQLLNKDWAQAEEGIEGLESFSPDSPELGKILQKELSLKNRKKGRARARNLFGDAL